MSKLQCGHYKMSQKIEHTGIITGIDDKTIQVSIIQKSACSDCHAKSACSVSDVDEKIIEVPNTHQGFGVGERVVLTGKSSMGLLAVLLAFVMPFMLILISLFVLRTYTSNEVLSGTLSLSILVPYYIILSRFDKKIKNKFLFFIEKENTN
ncbi:MAG: hypothetical protein H6Q20_1468 [Bacteroidetes bacterium]|nr:hypothetical protein [Bacteroidota bacterium]